MKCIVYGLYSSRDNELRYIGQTVRAPARRLSQHKNYAKNKKTAVHKWFFREQAEGFQVSFRVLCPDAVWNTSECELIAKHRAAGARLLNHTDGGEGTVGWHGNAGNKRPDLAERNRRNAGRPGHPMSAENKARLIAANTGRKRPDTVLRSLGNNYFGGRTHPPEWFEKMRGQKRTEETKAKMRAAWARRKEAAHA